MRFYVLFNSISVISGRCLADNERLCAMELRLWLRRFHPGVIKSDSPTPRATDFWGRASEKLPPTRPRTSVFYGQSCPKLMSFKRVKINNWLLNTHRQVA